MDTRKGKPAQVTKPTDLVSQWSVRTGLRGGDCQAGCENAVNDWKNQYFQLYEQAKYKTV